MTKKVQTSFLIGHIIDEMTKYLIEDFNLDIASALNVVYNSHVYDLLINNELELYSQSPAYIYELLKKEYLTARL